MINFFTSTNNMPSKKWTKLQLVLFLAVIFVALFLYVKSFNTFQIGAYMDDASYAVLAHSLVYSDSYGLMNYPGDPFLTRYPFGFPLFLSIVVRLFPNELGLLRIISLVATLLNIMLLFFAAPYFFQDNTYWFGLIVAALYSISPLVVGHANMVMSEPLFTSFALLAIYLMEKYCRSVSKNYFIVFILGAVTAFTIFIRTIGLVVLAAVVFRMIMTQTRRQIAFFVPALLAGGILLITTVIMFTSVSFSDLIPIEYLDQFQNPESWGRRTSENEVLSRLLDATKEYTTQHLREAIIPVGGGQNELIFGKRFGIDNLPLISGLIVGLVILIGMAQFIMGKGVSPTTLIFEATYFVGILFWPWRGPRFLYPMQPFLYLQLILGIFYIFRQLVKILRISKAGLFIPNFVALGVIGFLLFTSFYKGITDQTVSTDKTPDLSVGASWIKENSAQESIVMAQQPQAIYLYSHRKTIDFPKLSKPADLENYLFETGVSYVLISPELVWREDGVLDYEDKIKQYYIPELTRLYKKGSIELVFASTENLVRVYKVLQPYEYQD